MAQEDTDADTSIRIKLDTWRRLKDRKNRPNQSFDDVISELLDTVEADEGNSNSRRPVSM